jgi:hypothetical protein
VLLLDVARFKYQPHWISLPLLYEAMKPHDLVTGKPRGYFVIEKSAEPTVNPNVCKTNGSESLSLHIIE